MPKKRNTKLPAIKQLPSGAYHASVYSHTDADGKRHYESFTSFDYNTVLLEVAQFKADKKRAKTENTSTVPTLGEAMTEFVSIKTDVLMPMLQGARLCVANDPLRPVMNTICLDIHHDHFVIAASEPLSMDCGALGIPLNQLTPTVFP